MRVGVWWSAAALALLFVVTSALRTPQVDGTSRISRRLASPDGRGVSSTSKTEEVLPTFRPRSSRRREESTTVRKEETPRDVTRARTRSRPPDRDVIISNVSNQVQSQTPRNERFDSRRTSSRFRSREVEKEVNIDTSTARDNTVRSRTRSSIRRAPVPLPSSPVPVEVSTSLPADEKTEPINTNFEDISKTVPKEDNSINQFKRRSSTSRSIVETTTLKKNRGRGNRANSRSPDLEVSGTTNTLSALLGKEQTTARSGDLRDSRKLRYRTRPTETDTNLTGEGLAKLNEVVGSSQQKESSTSQSDVLPAPSVTIDNIAQQITEKVPIKTTKVIRRPLGRGKVNFRPTGTLPKTKVSEEVSEDDNYPASFKALIQAKNATQTGSSPSESLSVRASQKVFNTYPQSPQSIHTDQETDKESLLRSKTNLKEENEKVTAKPENLIETTIPPETSKSKSVEYRPRGTYTPRNRKTSSFTSSSTSPSSVTTEKPYKFSRKYNKVTTTAAPKSESSLKNKRAEITNSLKKPLSRSSYLSRKSTTTSNLSTQASTTIQNEKSENISTVSPKSRGILPRTAYYSRLRNKVSKTETSTELPKVDIPETATAEKKAENTVDMPVILTMLNGASKTIKMQDNNKDKGNNLFIIEVTSTESFESSNDNEVGDKVEETENKEFINIVSTTQKYHSHYNDKSDTATEQKVKVSTGRTPSIRNLKTRKYGRKPINRKDSENILVSSTPNIREKSLRKYSDTFSKTTEPSTNVITLESEKPKNRFSSKYRASYLDKPFYKPTVPTVTPSTAWLKFFVTDQQLTKSVEEPKWFEGEDSYDVTTQQMSRQNITIPTITHESSIELVEGEEIQLGPDMNAISFTQSGGTLSSADLRLSESLAKPLQVMNVEASHHSPSVTVSIFDALAEILTSTPRPRISTTTEVMQTQNTNSDVKQTLNGVSNNINVNSVDGFTSQDTLSTNSINTNTKSVQITDKITPNVFNSMSVGESVTPSLKTEEGKTTFVNTPLPASTLLPTTPTTPISARKPFAIKVLYSDTESSTDKITTAFVPPPPQPSTDIPTTVYNSVSDLLLSNNNLLVSSELTSMLSNNIKSIIQNMDEASKSRISVDMAKLLKSLIPRALDKLSTDLNNADSIPNTTPYSLEDISDTANIELNNQINSENILQNVTNFSINNVNIAQNNLDKSTVLDESSVNAQAVNSLNLVSTASLSDNQATVADVPLTTESPTKQSMFMTTNIVPITNNAAPLSISDTDSTNSPIFVNNGQSRDFATSTVDTLNVATNKPAPVPFLTNFKLEDITSNDAQNSNLPSTSLMNISPEQLEDIDNIQDPSQLSPLQLWILSKKARVLKMIEDLIRQHNTEIATGPLTDMINEPNVQFSSRLTEIMNTMNMTTVSSDLGTTTESTVFTTTSSTFPSSVLSTTPPNLSERVATENSQTTTLMASIIESTTLQIPLDVALSTTPTNIDNTPLQATSETAEAFPSTTPVATTESAINEDIFRSQEVAETTVLNNNEDQASTPTNTVTMESNTSGNFETTTIGIDTESTTVGSDSAFETTTQAGIDTTTITLINETKLNDVITVNSQLNVATPASIPKKDYVIFGILPNNTVVRKDPNDNVLESLTEASPYIIYGVLPNNTVIRKFPNGTRVPRIMQKIDVLPISPWSLRNPYSPIHNIPAIVRPRSNPIRVSTNTVTSTDTINNGTENQLTSDIVNNLQTMISSSTLNIKDSSSLGITTATNRPPAEKSTASHVLSLRTTTMLPSVDEILLNSISSAIKEEMVISSMTSSTREPRILTLDIDPETKQIRTEKPSNGDGNTVFKFIPIDEVMVKTQESNVLKLASTKMPQSNTMNEAQATVTESNNQIPQIQTRLENFNDPTSTTQMNAATPFETSTESYNTQPSNPMLMSDTVTTTESMPLTLESVTMSTTTRATTTLAPTTTQASTTMAPTTTTIAPTTTPVVTTTIPTTTPIITTTAPTTTPVVTTTIPTTTTTMQTTTPIVTTSTTPIILTTSAIPTTTFTTSTIVPSTTNIVNTMSDEADLLQSLLQGIARNPKNLKIQKNSKVEEEMKLLQALLSATGQNPNQVKVQNSVSRTQTTTFRSIEEDIRQYEEDTKLLKALLQATGRNPDELNLPSVDSIRAAAALTTDRPTTTTSRPTTTFTPITTTSTTQIMTPSINDDIRKLQEDTKLLQSLLQATGQNTQSANLPIISGITSNVRISSNPFATSVESNPTSPLNIRPVYTTLPSPVFTTSTPRAVITTTTFQSQPVSTATEDIGISTTFSPINQRLTTTPRDAISTQNTVAPRFTTEIPSTSTFSVEEDLAFLQNLKSVLNTNSNTEDTEAALANRIIALAVERSLNEIQSGTGIVSSTPTVPITTTVRTTTTRPTTTPPPTTRPTTTLATQSTPSIEDDIKQFEEDTKLLQALLKATGQDPSKFNIPSLPITKVSPNNISPAINEDLKLLSNLLANPSPLNEPFDSLTQKPSTGPSLDRQTASTVASATTVKPFGAKIAVKDDLKNIQDDAKLLQTLKQLQDAQDITTQKNKIALTGQSSDEALQKLIQQTKPSGMVSEATKSSISLSTEYGNSNDALLAALLKEQGFGPTTASSLDEQLRLSALLNQVVVTPKARRTTTPPPPPPAPRRPILDGLAWLWQQWRDTAPGSDQSQARPNRRPTPSARPSPSPTPTTSSRVNWFGSGPFVGNADDRPTSNRIPLEPPRAVAAEQTPGRGQLVSAAINVTRAFSQFLGAAIQGAAQTVQSVIRAGQRAATDVYSGGSGASG